jgi:hypothetical protein
MLTGNGVFRQLTVLGSAAGSKCCTRLKFTDGDVNEIFWDENLDERLVSAMCGSLTCDFFLGMEATLTSPRTPGHGHSSL